MKLKINLLQIFLINCKFKINKQMNFNKKLKLKLINNINNKKIINYFKKIKNYQKTKAIIRRI